MIFRILFSSLYYVAIVAFFLLMKISFQKYEIRVPLNMLPEYIQNEQESEKYTTNHAPEVTTKYSMFSRMISGLGNLLYASAPSFNTAMKIYAIPTTVLGILIFNLLPSHFVTILGLIGFEMGCIGIYLLGIYTENRHSQHTIVAGVAFGGFFGSVVFWGISVILAENISNWFLIIHVVPIIFLIYHMVAIRGFDLHEQMQDKDIRPLIKNYNFSEWLLLIGVGIWINGFFVLYMMA